MKNFSYTSNFNVGNLKNLKNSLSHFWTWNLKLKDLKNTLPHLRTYNTLKKSLSTPPTHMEKLQAPCMPPLGNELPLTLQSKKPCLKTILSFFFFLCNTSSNLSLLLVLTQCPFSCLVWAHNLLEITWKQTRNESFKVHEMEQLY